jgi:thioredoxin reductase
MLDVAIIGGGPAGLSAALVLGRCRRRVTLVDAGHPRNAASRALHGFLTRDGTPPLEMLRLGREELAPYGIEWRTAEVAEIVRAPEGFEIRLQDGERLRARTTLIASGVRDDLPPIPGIADCFGITVHHCPYCDGWEVRDKTLAVIGHDARSATALGLALTTWSARVFVCTNGKRVRQEHRRQLEAHTVAIDESPIAHLEHDHGHVAGLVTQSGNRLGCDAVFLATGQRPQSDLARRLGCEVTRRGLVKTDHLGQTCVPGVYVAGDASRDVQFAVVAAAEGAKAAVAINKALQAGAGLTVAP